MCWKTVFQCPYNLYVCLMSINRCTTEKPEGQDVDILDITKAGTEAEV